MYSSIVFSNSLKHNIKSIQNRILNCKLYNKNDLLLNDSLKMNIRTVSNGESNG